MPYRFSDLVDLPSFQQMMQSLYSVASVATALLHTDRNLLCAAGQSQGLQRVAAALLRKVSLGEVLEIVCTEAQQLTGASGSAVLLLEDDEAMLLRG